MLSLNSMSRPSILTLLLVSGTLSGLSTIYPPAWVLVFVAPIPFFAVLLNPTITSSRMRALAFGIVFGTAFNGMVNASGWSVYPLDWMGIQGPLLSVIIIGVAWIGLSLIMSVSSAIFAVALFEVRKRWVHSAILVIGTGVLWIITEPFRVFLFSLFMLGPTSTLQLAYNLGSVGYAFGNASSELWISLARWGGVPLLSLVPVLVSSCVALPFATSSVRTTVRRSILAAFGILTIFILGSWAASEAAERARGSTSAWNDTQELVIVAVQTRFPATLTPTSQDLERRTTIVYEIVRHFSRSGIEPNALILPEGVGTYLDADSYASIEAVLPADSLVIHSKYQPRSDGKKVVQTWARTIAGTTAVTDKQFIIPYGEYPPYHFLFFLKLFNLPLYEKLKEHREFAGGDSVALGSASGVFVGARICSEIFAANLYSSMARENGAGLLAHLSSVAMFHDSRLLRDAVRAASRIRAVENGLPIVQAVNGGRGTAFDCRGKELVPTVETPTYNAYAISRNDSCAGY